MANKVVVNGRDMPFDPHHMGTVYDLIRSMGLDPERRGLAAAVNGHVVRLRHWSEHTLSPGDRVEIVHPLAGG